MKPTANIHYFLQNLLTSMHKWHYKSSVHTKLADIKTSVT